MADLTCVGRMNLYIQKKSFEFNLSERGKI